MAKTLLKNARLVNEAETRDADLLIDGERIARIDSSIEASQDMTVLDLQGKYLLPGMIDDQVHFREPGMTHKGDLATESAAAAAGPPLRGHPDIVCEGTRAPNSARSILLVAYWFTLPRAACEDALPAAVMCQICEQGLCDKCAKSHRRIKATRTHPLIQLGHRGGR